MILEILFVLLGIPVGILISWLARDELLDGKKYFITIILGGLILISYSLIGGFYEISYSLAFLCLMAGVGLLKSKDKLWTKRRI